jgi:hypothetical protein
VLDGHPLDARNLQTRLGQGRENAKVYLKENPDVARRIGRRRHVEEVLAFVKAM